MLQLHSFSPFFFAVAICSNVVDEARRKTSLNCPQKSRLLAEFATMSRHGNQQGHEFGYGDRYDRLTNYSSSRNDGPAYRSDGLYDEHYGRGGSSSRDRNYDNRNRGGSGLGGQRNLSSYDRDQQYRGRDDRRSGGYRGGNPPSNAGGLLGASPSQPLPSAPGPGGMPGNQQLVAAIQAQQTQNILAALQAQQFNMKPRSLLPTPPGMNRGRGGGRYQNDRNRQRQFQGQKRRNQPQGQDQSPGMKRRKDEQAKSNYRSPQGQQWKQRQQNKSQQQSGIKDREVKPKRAEGEEDDVYEIAQDEETAIPEDLESIEIPQDLLDKVEELRKRTKIDRNIADQDVDKLSTFHYDGQSYKCTLCKVYAGKYKSIKQHFMGKRHSLNVIEARQAGNDVDRDIMDIVLHPESWLELNPVAKTILKKQTIGYLEAKRKEEEAHKVKHPEMYITYRMDTRKSALKTEDAVIIRHVCESVVAIKDFAGDKQLFGCEFIKASSGFDCRLCGEFLHTGTSVVDHIRTMQHIAAYQKHLDEHNNYHDKIVQRNKDISRVLEQHDGKEVILFEAFEEETENQQNIEKRYVNKEDPEFVRIEKEVAAWQQKDNEEQEKQEEALEEGEIGENQEEETGEGAYDEEQQEGEEMPPEEGYDEEDENVNGEGEEEVNEEQPMAEEEPLAEEEQVAEEEIGQEVQENVEQLEEMEEEVGKQEEELYEPSQPTEDAEADVELEQQQEEEPSPKKVEPPPAKKVLKSAPSPAARNPRPKGKVTPRGGSVRGGGVRGGSVRGGGVRGNARGAARGGRGGRAQQRSPRVTKAKPPQPGSAEKFEVIDELDAE
eukprot:Seg1807.2 transcript_id=Seg1807.2/GoldUCD/mRNA.D3Y31 product="hypothetical protein" protein_id=Seg1807.2/GoldUCD/D3Y31